MYSLDPILLDRDLERAEQAARAWRRRLRVAPDVQDNPLQPRRKLLGQSRFEQVSDLPEHDPLRQPLRRWIFRLAEQRINHYWLTLWHEQRYALSYAVDEPVRDQYTLDALFKKSLTDAPQRKLWVRALLAHSKASTHTFTTLVQRRQEIARRLELNSPDQLELPEQKDTLLELADTWLQRTSAPAEEFRRELFSDWLDAALGGKATEGFPAALKEHSIAQWFRETRLLEDLPLDTPRLPAGLASSSFMRGLEILGFGMRQAGAPRELPFVIGHDPYALEAHTLGSCFAGLLLNLPFILRNLQLDTNQARTHQRSMAGVVLLQTRLRAAKLKLRWHALAGADDLYEAFPEVVSEALGCDLPGDAAGVLLRQNVDDAQRFCAPFLAQLRMAQLVEVHDEDWYRNPRATDQIRSELASPPQVEVNREQLLAGLGQLEESLSQLLQ